MARLLLGLLMWALLPVVFANTVQQGRQIVQMAEYIGADYVNAVAQGQITSEDEYHEMQQFARLIVKQAAAMDDEALHQLAVRLQQAIDSKAGDQQIRDLTRALRKAVLARAPAVSLPVKLLDKSQVEALYQQQCAACHGQSGQGDGPASAGMAPEPTNFRDPKRAMQRSLQGLYAVISNGVEDTAMRGFAGQLSEQQRWSLAFFVGALAFADKAADGSKPDVPLQQWLQYSPQELRAEYPQLTMADLAYGRREASAWFRQESPYALALEQLDVAWQAYLAGDGKKAQQHAVSAYLDGFELVENNLNSYDSELRKTIERQMMQLRQLLLDSDAKVQVQTLLADVRQNLQRARQLSENQTLADSTLFASSLLILLREGLEALLVVLALGTVLARAGRRDGLRYVHYGWVLALLSGAATWLVARYFISISGASREVMEGVAALVAAVVLFYVGFWMHDKSQAAQWQAYIRRSVDRHLSRGALWGLAGLSFIAVYREVFETMLFYEALMTQASSAQMTAVWAGFGAGLLLLAAVAWLMIRFSVILPLGQFFRLTTWLLLALAVILTGKAVVALQEANWITQTPLPVDIDFPWLGLSSSWQALGAQLLVLLVAAVLLYARREKGGQPQGRQREA